jgi:2-polyprenyl-3-methyl-5-hydroxy-6-metoxy-1,4-benzoquinol methylase
MKDNRYRTTIQTWDKLAQAYQDRFMDFDLYDDTYDAFCESLKPGARVLEIGCGPGNITRYLLRKRPDLDILATDVAPSMVERARNNNPTARFQVMDAREIGRLGTQFDGIICGFCIPYLEKTDVVQLIQNCASLLHDNGIFYFSVIENDYARSGFQTDSSGKNKTYVYCYDAHFLQEQLINNGFEITQLYRKIYLQKDIHLIGICHKKTERK